MWRFPWSQKDKNTAALAEAMAAAAEMALPSPPEDPSGTIVSPNDAWLKWKLYRDEAVKIRGSTEVTPVELNRETKQVEVLNYSTACVKYFHGNLDQWLGDTKVVRALPPPTKYIRINGDFAYHEKQGNGQTNVRNWTIDDMNFKDADWFRYAYKHKLPIVGSILILIQKGGNHLIAYLLRPAEDDRTELVLLEPYDTNMILVTEKSGGMGRWRDVILETFRDFFVGVGGGGREKIELVAAMETSVKFNLTKKDAGEGQCAFWAMRMLQEFAVHTELLAASPDTIRNHMRELLVPSAAADADARADAANAAAFITEADAALLANWKHTLEFAGQT